jgi:hypothetical protein
MLTFFGQIEHAFLMFVSGKRVDMGMFSRDLVGTIVGEYAYTASLLSNRRWDKIKALCGARSMEERPRLKVNSIQFNRRALYEPSSPIRESDDE